MYPYLAQSVLQCRPVHDTRGCPTFVFWLARDPAAHRFWHSRDRIAPTFWIPDGSPGRSSRPASYLRMRTLLVRDTVICGVACLCAGCSSAVLAIDRAQRCSQAPRVDALPHAVTPPPPLARLQPMPASHEVLAPFDSAIHALRPEWAHADPALRTSAAEVGWRVLDADAGADKDVQWHKVESAQCAAVDQDGTTSPSLSQAPVDSLTPWKVRATPMAACVHVFIAILSKADSIVALI